MIRLNSDQVNQIRETNLTEDQLQLKREKIEEMDKKVLNLFNQIYVDVDSREGILAHNETYVNCNKKYSVWNGKGEMRIKMSATYHKTEGKKKK